MGFLHAILSGTLPKRRLRSPAMQNGADDGSQYKPPFHLQLPPAPADLTGPVKAWRADVEILTYEPGKPDLNPMFLEKRVYQGSSGVVYPLPFIDRIATEPEKRNWKAIHIENEYLRLMILPEIGGRIHIGYDKTTGYDFFYRQNVIKPALVDLPAHGSPEEWNSIGPSTIGRPLSCPSKLKSSKQGMDR